MSELDIVGIRDAEEDDKGFIIDAWLSSFRNSHFAGPISMSRYRDIYRTEIVDLMLRPEAHVRVAYNRDIDGQLFGFLCFERGRSLPVIHFSYVKRPFRKRGIFLLLAKDAGINTRRKFIYTYRTRMASELSKQGQRFERAKFDPFDARFSPKEQRDEATQDQEHCPT